MSFYFFFLFIKEAIIAWWCVLGCFAVLVCFVSGCGGSKDLMKQKQDALEEAAGVVENVYTEGAAPAAKPDLERIGKKLRELDQQIAALPADQKAEQEKKYKAGIDA